MDQITEEEFERRYESFRRRLFRILLPVCIAGWVLLFTWDHVVAGVVMAIGTVGVFFACPYEGQGL